MQNSAGLHRFNSTMFPQSHGESEELRRKRIRQACLSCRKKKIRCDGRKPICDCCQRSSQNCVYAWDGRRARSASFHLANFGGALESFAGEMSTRFMSLEERLARIESSMISKPTTGTSNMDQMSERVTGQNVVFQNRLLEEEQDRATDNQTSSTIAITPASTDDAFNGISYEAVSFAADVYFRFCHNQPYSLFHEATFRARMQSRELPEHIIWALLAIARQYSTLPGLDQDSADDATKFAQKSWVTLTLPWDGSATEEEAVSVVQTLVLLVCVDFTEGSSAAAYMKLGFGIRLALFYRLHIQPKADTGYTPITLEERKRTFWSLFLQDKLMSLSPDRFSSLQDEECRVSLPCSETAFRDGRAEETTTLSRFTTQSDCLDKDEVDKCCPLALVMVMASVLNRVSRYVLQENRFAELGAPWASSSPHNSISSTLLQLELHFGMNKTYWQSVEQRCADGAVEQNVAGPFIYSKAVYHLTQCLLHHPFLLQQRLKQLNQRAPASFAQAAWLTCRTHAKYLTNLRDIKNHNILVLTPIYSYCTMVAGTIHVLAMNDTDASVRKEHMAHHNMALQFLIELSGYWKHAALMTGRFERFRQQIEGRKDLFDYNMYNNGPAHVELQPVDVKLLWQSVDYASLSAPSPPGSPKPFDIAPLPDFFMSPIRLFDMAHDADSYSNFSAWDHLGLQVESDTSCLSLQGTLESSPNNSMVAASAVSAEDWLGGCQ